MEDGNQTEVGTQLESGAETETGGLDFIPEEYRESSWATKYNNPNDFFKGIENMSKLVGQKTEGVRLPGEDATDEDWDSFFNSIGRPESPDKYDLKTDIKVEGFDMKEEASIVSEIAHKSGLSNVQAQKLFDNYSNYIKENAPQSRSNEEILSEAFGDKAEEKFKLAKRVSDTLGLGDKLDEAGLSKEPLVLQLLADVGSRMKESSLIDARGSNDSIEEVQAEIDKIRKSKDYFRDISLSQKVEKLTRKLHSMKGQ